jgi:Zinc knuckle
LSEKEKAELVGKCYLCKEPGHMARNCPWGNKVRFNTSKPPGTSNFNVEFDDSVEVLESLPLRMVEVER